MRSMRTTLRIALGLFPLLAAAARADDVSSKRTAFLAEVDKLMAARTPASEGSGSGSETRAVRRYEEGAEALRESLLESLASRTRAAVKGWAVTGDVPGDSPVEGASTKAGAKGGGEARFLEDLLANGRELVLAKARLDLLRGALGAANAAYPKRKEAVASSLREAEKGLVSGETRLREQGRALACNVEETLVAQDRFLDAWLRDTKLDATKFQEPARAFDSWAREALKQPGLDRSYLDAVTRWSDGYEAARKDYMTAWNRAIEIRAEIEKGKVCPDCTLFRDVAPDAVCRTAKDAETR